MSRTFLAIILLLIFSTSAVSQTETKKNGAYSRYATSIWGSRRELAIPSPDGKKAILVLPPRKPDSDEMHAVSVKVNGREFKTGIGLWVNAEVLWSPDSEAFFVTYSDGGNIGTYHVKVFYVAASGLRIVEPIPNGRKLFVPLCFDREYPNVAGIRWMGPNASRLLIAVEVPSHSSCASMGTFRAFEISLPDGRIVNRFGQIGAKKLFEDYLGSELRAADDSCVEKPQTCIPTGLKTR